VRATLPLILAAALVAGLVPAGADDPPAKPAPAPTVAKFDHLLHANAEKLEKPIVAEDSCQSCHPTDAKGTLTMPGKTGHQPCLASGCHVSEFLAIGPSTREKEPETYRKAAAFCAGCHNGEPGTAPRRHEKPPTDNIFGHHPSPNYHVEIAHFEHIGKKDSSGADIGCRDCHVVDRNTNALQLNSPGHAECSRCHGKNAPPMSDCAQCHQMPGPTEYFSKLRKGSEIRSCGSAGHAKEAKRRGKPQSEVSCFKHETKRHRFQEDGSRLECSACHYMFADKRYWGRHKYDTLKNIAAAPAMEDQRDKAHQMCGRSRACHQRDVRSSGSGRKCDLCHAKATIENEMFD
jgi:hypothetical protein